MTIQEREVGSVMSLDLGGRLVLGDGDEALRTAVQKLLAAGHKQILLNLAEVAYVDSAGLGALASALIEARRQQGSLRMHSPSKRLRDLLVMTRLVAALEISDSESQALAGFTEVKT
jgi:anti-sigma B factor antagonist